MGDAPYIYKENRKAYFWVKNTDMKYYFSLLLEDKVIEIIWKWYVFNLCSAHSW